MTHACSEYKRGQRTDKIKKNQKIEIRRIKTGDCIQA